MFITFSYYATATRVVWEFNRIYRELEGALTDAAQFTDLLLDPPAVVDRAPVEVFAPADFSVELRNVGFRYGSGGAFLFGAFGATDAMYAPVVSRFHTYAVEVGAVARAYMEAVMALPAWREWHTAALAEPWVLPEDEVDWPTVMRV